MLIWSSSTLADSQVHVASLAAIPYSGSKEVLWVCTLVQRLVTEHMQVPFSVTQGRYLLAQVLAYAPSLMAVP